NLLSAVRRLNRPDEVASVLQLIANQRPNDFLANAAAATALVEQTPMAGIADTYTDRMRRLAENPDLPPNLHAFLEFLPAYTAWLAGDLPTALEQLAELESSLEHRPQNQRTFTLEALVFHFLALGRARDAERI